MLAGVVPWLYVVLYTGTKVVVDTGKLMINNESHSTHMFLYYALRDCVVFIVKIDQSWVLFFKLFPDVLGLHAYLSRLTIAIDAHMSRVAFMDIQ